MTIYENVYLSKGGDPTTLWTGALYYYFNLTVSKSDKVNSVHSLLLK